MEVRIIYEFVIIIFRLGVFVVNLFIFLNFILIDEVTVFYDEVLFLSRVNFFVIGWLLYLLRVYRKNSRE